MLTGSNIDIQLAMDPTVVEDATHYKSILGIKVYAPADGLVVGGHPSGAPRCIRCGSPRSDAITLTPDAIIPPGRRSAVVR